MPLAGDWTTAHRVAHVAAAHAHADLRVSTSRPVDVYSAIHAAGLTLVFRPMARLFGVYCNEDEAAAGILINSTLPSATQRHTAAHELGHHLLRHSTTLDVDLEPLTEQDNAPWTAVEMAAEAFATWFTMPRKAVAAGLQLLGLERPSSPEDVYRLSLFLGTTYRGTARHLPNLRLATRSQSAAWLKVPPSRIKARLDAGAPQPHTRRHDVWVLDDGFNGVSLAVRVGDRIIVRLAEEQDAPCWRLTTRTGLIELGQTHEVGTPHALHRFLMEVASDQAITALAAVKPDPSEPEARDWSVFLMEDPQYFGLYPPPDR